MQPLPILDNVRVASPCSIPWRRMRGDDRVRHCDRCDRKVFNLSNMTRGDAEHVLKQHGFNLCVRFYKRHDGTMVTTDCPPPRSLLWKFAAIFASACGVASIGGCQTQGAVLPPTLDHPKQGTTTTSQPSTEPTANADQPAAL